MECKVTICTSKFLGTIIKVEPYWNVKEVAFVHALDTEAIKVEPYWNVKVIMAVIGGILGAIKVEPYWNVKIP